MKKILVPIDGSKHSDLALEMARKFSDAFGCSVVLLHVNDFHHHMFNYNQGVEEHFIDIFEQMSKDILKEGKTRLSELGDRVETVQMEGGIANKIIEYAEKNDFDLIIIGSHGRGMIHNFLIGDVAHKVALHADKPVLLAR